MKLFKQTTAIALVLLPLAMSSYANAADPTAGLKTLGTSAPLLSSVVKPSQISGLTAANAQPYVILQSPTGTPQIYTLGCGEYGRAARAGCTSASEQTGLTTASTPITVSKPATSSGPLSNVIASSNAREATVQAQNERTNRVAGYNNSSTVLKSVGPLGPLTWLFGRKGPRKVEATTPGEQIEGRAIGRGEGAGHGPGGTGAEPRGDGWDLTDDAKEIRSKTGLENDFNAAQSPIDELGQELGPAGKNATQVFNTAGRSAGQVIVDGQTTTLEDGLDALTPPGGAASAATGQ